MISWNSSKRIKPESWLNQVLGHAAGIGLFGLTAIYSLGSLSYAGQMIEVGTDPRAGMSFLSVEDILIRGIASLTQPFTLLMLALYGFFIYLTFRRPDPAPGSLKARGAFSTQDNAQAIAIGFGVGGVGGMIGAGWPDLLAYVPMTAVAIYVFANRNSNNLIGTRRLTVMLSLAIATMALLNTFMSPKPLENASLELRSGRSITGDYLTHRDGAWVLLNGKEVLLVPSRNVLTVTLTPG